MHIDAEHMLIAERMMKRGNSLSLHIQIYVYVAVSVARSLPRQLAHIDDRQKTNAESNENQ